MAKKLSTAYPHIQVNAIIFFLFLNCLVCFWLEFINFGDPNGAQFIMITIMMSLSGIVQIYNWVCNYKEK